MPEDKFVAPVVTSQSQLESIQLKGSHRRFLVLRMGATGSTWLAKLLNSHPDVCCYHESVLAKVYPASEHGEEDILLVVRYLAENGNHDAYQAMGDVGSIWLSHIAPLRQKGFATALLVRHPAKLLFSRLRLWPDHKPYLPIHPESLDYIHATWGIKASEYSELDQYFLHDALVFASQSQCIKDAGLCIRIEDMSSVDYCSHVVETLTGVRYERKLLEKLIRAPVNQRSGYQPHMTIRDILMEFSATQREWYRLMLGDIAPLFGYSLET
jgi:hypothetical protein